MPMLDSTPYRLRPAKEVAREQECMRHIFRGAPEVALVFEAFGGTGVTAEVLRKRFPQAALCATDLDAECVRRYNEALGYDGHCSQMDAREGLRQLETMGMAWGASLDYNRFTLLDLETGRNKWKYELLDAALRRRPEWVQIMDSAVRYLHLNFGRYGLKEKSLHRYVERLAGADVKRWGYRLLDWRGHSAATYLLFGR